MISGISHQFEILLFNNLTNFQNSIKRKGRNENGPRADSQCYKETNLKYTSQGSLGVGTATVTTWLWDIEGRLD